MKHIQTVNQPTLQLTRNSGGCGECQASCQSACKTSCTVGTQVCESKKYGLEMRLPFAGSLFSLNFRKYFVNFIGEIDIV